MGFLNWIERNWGHIIGFFGIILTAATSIYQINRTAKVQIKQIRPAITHHECRVCWLGIYTFFDENNKLSDPGCAYLSKKTKKCMFNPENLKESDKKNQAKEILEINENKCYFSNWSK